MEKPPFHPKVWDSYFSREKRAHTHYRGKALCEKIAAHELLQSKIYLLRFGEGWSVWIG